ncbi:MAG: hypothetical protein IKL94_01575 [Clostridia bacterium]|nr:hypothetical protein [Clostridia bacterium]
MKNKFKDKGKNIIAIIFTTFYSIMLILNIDIHLPFIQNFRYIINSLVIDIIPLITPVLILVYLLSLNKEYKLKKWLFPVAFGVKVIHAFLTLCGIFSTIGLIYLTLEHTLILLCLCLIFVAVVFMFIGTFFDFKHINFIRYGALSCAVLNLATLIIDFIAVGGFKYLQTIPIGTPAVNLIALITILTCTLFYIGIFILSFNKTKTDKV